MEHQNEIFKETYLNLPAYMVSRNLPNCLPHFFHGKSYHKKQSTWLSVLICELSSEDDQVTILYCMPLPGWKGTKVYQTSIAYIFHLFHCYNSSLPTSHLIDKTSPFNNCYPTNLKTTFAESFSENSFDHVQMTSY